MGVDMNPNTITITEGEVVTYTFTVKRDGSVVDLTGYTVTIYVHDDDAAFGTNKVDGGACVLAGDPTTGVCTYDFTTANTTFATDRDFRGKWALKLDDGAGDIEWTAQEPFYIIRNPFVAEG